MVALKDQMAPAMMRRVEYKPEGARVKMNKCYDIDTGSSQYSKKENTCVENKDGSLSSSVRGRILDK